MSTPRYCAIWKASNNSWYLDLAVHEYAQDYDDDDYDAERSGNPSDGQFEDCVTYGPFSSEKAAEAHLDNFSNPGSLDVDPSGKEPPPTKSPNGTPVISPRGRSSYSSSYVASDVGEVPKSQPVKAPEVPGKTYKVYGKKNVKIHPKGNPVAAPIHTRLKGKVYAPFDKTRFKSGDSVSVTPLPDKDDRGISRQIRVNNPDNAGPNQFWNVDRTDEAILRRFIVEALKTKS